MEMWFLLGASIFALVIVVGFAITKMHDAAIVKKFPSTGHITKVAGGTVHWTCQGKGPNVVLIHGLAGNKHNFAALEKELASSFTVYAIDRPGSGHSKRERNTDASFSYQAAMILEWMEKQSIDSALIVGHSMGGGIALNLAIQAPERVSGLALICPLTAPLSIKASVPVKLFFRFPWVRYSFSKLLLPFVGRRLSKRQLPAIFAPEPIDKQFAKTYGGVLSTHSDAFFAASSDLAGAQRSLFQQIQRYSEITCPVGVIYGAGDRILAPALHTQMIEKTIPTADILLLEGRGHMIPITVPQEVSQFIHKIHGKNPDLDKRSKLSNNSHQNL